MGHRRYSSIMNCTKFYIYRVDYPILTVQNVCEISVNWGAYIDIRGRRYIDRNGRVYKVRMN